MKSISNKAKGNNSKNKKASVVILVSNRPSASCFVLHFNQVSSKYSKGLLSYRANNRLCVDVDADADTDADADANGIRPKHSMSSSPFSRGGGGHNVQADPQLRPWPTTVYKNALGWNLLCFRHISEIWFCEALYSEVNLQSFNITEFKISCRIYLYVKNLILFSRFFFI